MKKNEIIDIFIEIEERYNLWEYEINNIKIWQYVRFAIHTYVEEYIIGNEYEYLYEDLKTTVGIQTEYKQIENYQKQFELQKKDMLVINFPRRVKEGEIYNCCFTDTLLKNIDYSYYVFEDPSYGITHYLPVETQNLKYRNVDILRGYYINNIKIDGKKIRNFVDKITLIFNQEYDIKISDKLKNKLFRQIHWTVESYFYREKHAQIILSLIQPKICLVVVSPELNNQVLIKVAKQMGIPTVELAHGMQSEHISHIFAKKRELESYPDYMFVFGEYDKITPRYPIPDNQVFITGRPEMEKYLKKQPKKYDTEKIILYLLGPNSMDVYENAISLYRKLENKDYKIIYKLHPSEYGSWRKLYPQLINTDIEVIDTNEHDIYYYLSKANYVVGNVATTAMFEATVFDAEVLVLKNSIFSSMQEVFVQKGYATLVSTAEDIYDILENNHNKKKTNISNYFYAENALENMKNALEICMAKDTNKINYNLFEDVKTEVEKIKNINENDIHIKACEQNARNNRAYFILMSEWFKKKQQNKSIINYLLNQGYKNIAIYGMDVVGELLYNELVDSEITVEYGIDKAGGYSKISIYLPEEELNEVDAIIVTPVYYYSSIVKVLEKKTTCPILSLADIVYQI